MQQDNLLQQIIKLKEQLRDLFFQRFFAKELWSWVWWLSIGIILVCIIVWWKLVDKKRLIQICMFGLIIDVIAVFLDVSGSEFVLWEYPVHVLPQIPLLIPVDFIILPTVQMYIYQTYTKWGKYLLFSVIFSAVEAFIAEPLAVWIGQYQLIRWEYYFSFPIYFLMDVIAKFFVDRFMAVQLKALSKDKK